MQRMGGALPEIRSATHQPANVLIIEPSLKGYAGHCHNDVLSLEQMIHQAGMNCTALISRSASAEIISQHQAEPIFRHNPYQRASRPGLAGFLKITGGLYLSLATFLRKAPVRYDCVVLRTASQELLAVVADLVHAGLLPSSVRVMAWLLFEPAWNTRAIARHRARHEAEYRRALSRLETILDSKDQISLYTELKELSALHSECLQRPVVLCEVPNLARRDDHPTRRGSNEPVRIMMLGYAAEDKGYGLLADAIRHLRDRGILAEFHVHAASDRFNPSAMPAYIAQLQALQPPIHFSSTSLDEAKYMDWLKRADLLLLPYRMPDYARRGSGIYNQASLLGIPMVVNTQVPFAAEALAEERAVHMSEYTSLALAEAIERALADLEGLQSRALQAAQRQAHKVATNIIEGVFLDIAKAGTCPNLSRNIQNKFFDYFRSMAAIICAPTWLKSSPARPASNMVQ